MRKRSVKNLKRDRAKKKLIADKKQLIADIRQVYLWDGNNWERMKVPKGMSKSKKEL